jgi:adenosine deaminase
MTTTTFDAARAAQTLKELPKYNSHCHLGGEVPLTFLEKYATAEQIQAIHEGLAEIAKGKEYQKAFFIFRLISVVINTHERLKEAAYATCERLKTDNNQIVLMRTGLKVIEGKSYEEYLKSVLAGVEQAAAGNFSLYLLLSLKRSSTEEMAKTTVDIALRYRDRGVVGIDISDLSTEGDIRTIMPELLRAKKEGLKIAVHMGESPEEKDQMLIINALQPDIIDHGVNLCEQAEEWVRTNHIPITLCLTSSLATKMHDTESSHPWLAKFLNDENCLIDFGTDDATVFGNITLSDEFLKLCPDLGLQKVIEIATKSFNRAQELFKSTASVL